MSLFFWKGRVPEVFFHSFVVLVKFVFPNDTFIQTLTSNAHCLLQLAFLLLRYIMKKRRLKQKCSTGMTGLVDVL